MPFALGPFASAAAPFVSSALSFIGGERAREQTQASTREQMAFQERMSSTAHQREVADLRKAGLNPILSANRGASSPGGSSMVANDTVTPAVNQAWTAKMASLGLAEKQATIDNLTQQAAANSSLAALRRAQTDALSVGARVGETAGDVVGSLFSPVDPENPFRRGLADLFESVSKLPARAQNSAQSLRERTRELLDRFQSWRRSNAR